MGQNLINPAIGQTFFFEGRKLTCSVTTDDNVACKGCAFFNEEYSDKCDQLACNAYQRNDKTDVIFVQSI